MDHRSIDYEATLRFFAIIMVIIAVIINVVRVVSSLFEIDNQFGQLQSDILLIS